MLNWALVAISVLFVGLICSALGQTDDLASVLENAQKSLVSNSNISADTRAPLFSVPPDADFWARMKLEPHEYIENRYVIPSQSSFNFSSASILCPKGPCEQEFFDGVLRKESFSPNKYFFHGVLKIIDKSDIGNPDIKGWLYYPFDADFLIKSTKENSKTGNTVEKFTGGLGLDRDELKFSDPHDIQYSITGTFEQPSNILTLVGRTQ